MQAVIGKGCIACGKPLASSAWRVRGSDWKCNACRRSHRRAPTHSQRVVASSLQDRVRALVVADGAGCWIWQGRIDRHGYGRTNFGGGGRLAHRISYRAFRGEIPAGLELDHLCRNTKCCNPAHLEPVTGAENRRRQKHVSGSSEHEMCRRGHPLSGSNVASNGKGKRTCRECRRVRQRVRWLAIKKNGSN